MSEQVVTAGKLRQQYGPQAPRVLKQYLERLPREKRQQQKYRVVHPLPDRDEYARLRDAVFATLVEVLVVNACDELSCLREELQDWYDNLPEAFQRGDKGSQLEEAVSLLDGCGDPPEMPDGLGKLATVFVPDEGVSSRSHRRDEACRMLRAAVDCLEGYRDRADAGTLQELVGAIAEIADNAESVEFPGMY